MINHTLHDSFDMGTMSDITFIAYSAGQSLRNYFRILSDLHFHISTRVFRFTAGINIFQNRISRIGHNSALLQGFMII